MTDVQVTDRDREAAETWLVHAFEDETDHDPKSCGLDDTDCLARVIAQARAEGFAAGVAQEREAPAAGPTDETTDHEAQSVRESAGMASGSPPQPERVSPVVSSAFQAPTFEATMRECWSSGAVDGSLPTVIDNVRERVQAAMADKREDR